MDSICLVLDFDGIMAGRNFYVRELGFKPLTDPHQPAASVRFHLDHHQLLFACKDVLSAQWCYENLHGISLKPAPGEKTLSHDHLKFIVKSLWEDFRLPDQDVVAYKGGHFEKDVLKELGIPHVNLEVYGCPKWHQLDPPSIRDCGYHAHRQKHCSRVKAHVYARWIENELLEE